MKTNSRRLHLRLRLLKLRLRLFKLVGLFVLGVCANGCAVDLIGTGAERSPNGDGANNQNQNPPAAGVGTLDPPASPPPPPAVGKSGAPVDIEALFDPPSSDVVSPDKLFGVWAGTTPDDYADERMRVRETDITFAKKCKDDGKIAFVYVKVRATESKITLVESKRANLGYPNSLCSFSLELVVGEWLACNAQSAYNCFEVYGTKLMGMPVQSETGMSTRSWLKLTD